MDVHTNPGPTSNDKHSLDIIHLNTRSIRNKMDNLSPVVDSFHVVFFSLIGPIIVSDVIETLVNETNIYCSTKV